MTQNSEMADIRKNFYEIYNKKLQGILSDFEKKRKAWILNCILIGIAGILIMVFCIKIAPFISVAIPFLYCLIVYQIDRDFKKSLKASCSPFIIKAFEELKWRTYGSNKAISDCDLEFSELFAFYTNRADDDVFIGKYNGVDYAISETELLEIVEYASRRRMTHRVFKGVIINLIFNKQIRTSTIITSKGDLNVKGRRWALYAVILNFSLLLFASTILMLNGVPKAIWCVILFAIALIVAIVKAVLEFRYQGSKLIYTNKIKFEDNEFNKKYDVYSFDEIEARYLITPAFMERFKNMQTAFGTKRVKCSFYDDKIMFAITTNKNLFELGSLFRPVTDYDNFNKFFKELTSILKFIDYFKLDEKTGL